MPTTWNPADKTANITLSNGNLTATSTNSLVNAVRALDRAITGKYYWEITATTYTGSISGIGVASYLFGLGTSFSNPGARGCAGLMQAGSMYIDGASVGNIFSSIASGTVVCVALDMTNKLIWYRLGAAGNWNNNAGYNPAGTPPTGGFSLGPNVGAGIPVYPVINTGINAEVLTANFGATAYVGTAPSGFSSFPSGTTSNSNQILTQAAVEEFAAAATPQMRLTQASIEEIASAAALQAQITQMGLEQWAGNAPQVAAQITQLALEQWGNTTTTPTQAMLTEIGIEAWASVIPTAPTFRQAYAMVLA